jgi:hypothetical protein
MTDTLTTADAMEAAALNRQIDAEGHDSAPPVPKNPGRPVSPAEFAVKRLALYLKAFEEALDDEHEAAMGFAAGPGDGMMRIAAVGFSAPDLVTLSGITENGDRTQLIQHVSQLNVALRAVRKPAGRAPYRIGFRLARALEESDGSAQDATEA